MELLPSAVDREPVPRAAPRLTDEGFAVLRSALEKHIASPSPNTRSGLRHAIERICLDARRSDWPPESILVALKRALEAIPAVARLARGPERDEFVAPLVSLCIAEYYRRPSTFASELPAVLPIGRANERARPRSAEAVRANTSTIAAKSLSRRLLLRLLSRRELGSRRMLAAHLAISESTLGDYESGARLMPLDLQERLAAYVLAREPEFGRLARQLQGQIQAALRYQAGDVVRHLTSPR
jgi:hypothetical protein